MTAPEEQIIARPTSFLSSRNLFVPFLFLGLLLAIVVGFYEFSASEPRREPLTTEPRGETITNLDFEIIHREADDQIGRTYFYSGRFLFDGIGSFKRPVGATQIIYIDYTVGALSKAGLEPAEDGGYLLELTNPQTREPLSGKMRLTNRDVGSFSPTKILVENLNADPRGGVVALVGLVSDYNAEQMGQLIKPGDALAVEFAVQNEEILRDEGGFPIVNNLFLRRFGGISTLAAEVNFALVGQQ